VKLIKRYVDRLDWADVDFEITRNDVTDYMWWYPLLYTTFPIPPWRIIVREGGTKDEMDPAASKARGGYWQ
jgi:hypothetical protein